MALVQTDVQRSWNRGSTIFVGLNPSKSKKSSSYVRFKEWMDYVGIHHYSFVNLSSDPDWDFKFTSFEKQFIIQVLSEHTKIVCWGDRVANYVKRLGFQSFTLPHPSGLNRKINDREFVITSLDNLRHYLND